MHIGLFIDELWGLGRAGFRFDWLWALLFHKVGLGLRVQGSVVALGSAER